ncbi:hypothetical protein V3C99_010925, partial [Haemonchus contortus]
RKMNIVVLKALLLGVMAATTVLFGVIPLKVLQILSRKSGKFEQRASFTISLLSCFAGGVFLAVCFLDILPEAYESYESWKTAAEYKSEYPFVPLMFSMGFFIVRLLEEIVDRFCGHEEYAEERRKHAATFVSVASDMEINHHIDHHPADHHHNDHIDHHIDRTARADSDSQSSDSKTKIVKSLTFVIALMFHASLEGVAFGVQDTTVSVASLFFGIIVHKAVVSFSVGMRLAEAHTNRRWLVVALICAFAIVAPIGGAVGIVLQDSTMHAQTRDAVTCILQSLALGTFIYITFFEILVPESTKPYNKIAQWLASVIGFAIIAALMSIGE